VAFTQLTDYAYTCNLYAVTIVSTNAMKKIPKISEAEWEVMKVLWTKGPCSSGEIVESLISGEPSRHPKTIKTYLGRLTTKKAVAFRREGRGYLYRPLVAENECVKAVAESFLERVFGGSIQPLLAHFVQQKKLSAEEIQELKRLLDEQEQ
jgi:BlaI family penicillinase repressor